MPLGREAFGLINIKLIQKCRSVTISSIGLFVSVHPDTCIMTNANAPTQEVMYYFIFKTKQRGHKGGFATIFIQNLGLTMATS